jgi:hypothetical protein
MALILSGDTGVPASGMPTGSVIQTVSSTYNTQTSMTGTTPVASGLTATITPQFSNSKILVMVSQNGIYLAINNQLTIQSLFRGATSLFNFDYISGYTSAGNAAGGTATISYLDSPGLTSAITYSTKIAGSSAGTTVNWNNGGCTSTITLLEIKV